MAADGAIVSSVEDVERMTRDSLGVWEVSINRGGEVMTSVFRG